MIVLYALLVLILFVVAYAVGVAVFKDESKAIIFSSVFTILFVVFSVFK